MSKNKTKAKIDVERQENPEKFARSLISPGLARSHVDIDSWNVKDIHPTGATVTLETRDKNVGVAPYHRSPIRIDSVRTTYDGKTRLDLWIESEELREPLSDVAELIEEQKDGDS